VSWGIGFRVRRRLRDGADALPFLGVVVGSVLAELSVRLDEHVRLPETWQYSAATATGLLSVLVGAMVGLIGFVVTVTVLVIQQATGTLSPRYMRLWYRDPFQKIVLATFAGTLTFSFSLLRRVTDNAVPDIGVTAAGVLVTISVLLLLWYVARFAHALRPVAVAAQVADAGRRVVDRLPRFEPTASRVKTMTTQAGPSTVVRSTRAGAIQAIDGRGLLAFARKHDCPVVLLHSVGDFVPTGAGLVRVYGPAPRAAQRRLRRMFALGRERTLEQDPAFALRILVDIAIRALSPAVNDPTTAVQVLDYIEELLLDLARRWHAGHGELRDAQGRCLVVIPVRSWEQYLELATTEIRGYGATSVQVLRRLRATLEELAADVPAQHRASVERELRKLDLTVTTTFPTEVDRPMAGASDRQGLGGFRSQAG
jgi:uncharacterized membrane protein